MLSTTLLRPSKDTTVCRVRRTFRSPYRSLSGELNELYRLGHGLSMECCLGVGGMEPDPTKVTECDEGYTIRLEKPVKAADSETRSLLYNECVSFVPYLFQTRRILKCELSYGCLWFLSEMSIL